MDTIENDVYIAYQVDNGTCIAMDEFSISQISSGFQINSNNTVFGINGFQQKASLKTDFQWQMHELNIFVDSMNIEMNAIVKEGKAYVKQNKQNTVGFEKIIDLKNDKFFFQYNGALVIPMIWLRGFDFDNYKKVTYQMLPMGYAEVKQLPNTATCQEFRDLSLLMYVQNFTDIIKIRTDMSGKLLSLQSETNQLLIKLQT